ncbi:hypothetical protein QE152_g36510 [Popillia japonica]|uniref:Uncharacterized protein n=1 Tax=Popillia japonica TaxID=7064 RepID=A0AAW1IDI6_POPJA
MASDAPYYMTNAQLLHELNIETLGNIIQKNTINTLAKMETHQNPTIRKILKAKRKTIKKEGITALKRKAEENPEVNSTEKKSRREPGGNPPT